MDEAYHYRVVYQESVTDDDGSQVSSLMSDRTVEGQTLYISSITSSLEKRSGLSEGIDWDDDGMEISLHGAKC